METTEKHLLPYILAAQAQKHVTHNEALRALDALVQISIQSRTETSPPADPQPTNAYLVPSGASGDWQDHEDKFLVWQDGAWAVHQPQSGWVVWIEDEETLIVYDGTAFLDISDIAQKELLEIGNLQGLGINTAVDPGNPLSVRSNSSLFSHNGGGHRISINKASSVDTASLIFQSNWSGRVEMGLSGEDNFSFKVSNDGSNFHNAI